MSTHWTHANHFLTWFKNNVERKKKYLNMLNESRAVKGGEDSIDPEHRGLGKCLFFKIIVRLIANIQALHSNPSGPLAGTTKLTFYTMPEPMPDYIRPKIAKLLEKYTFKGIDVDVPMVAPLDDGLGAFRRTPAYVSAAGSVAPKAALSADGHSFDPSGGAAPLPLKRNRVMTQVYAERDLYAQTFKKPRALYQSAHTLAAQEGQSSGGWDGQDEFFRAQQQHYQLQLDQHQLQRDAERRHKQAKAAAVAAAAAGAAAAAASASSFPRYNPANADAMDQEEWERQMQQHQAAAGFYKAKIKDLMVEDLVVGAGRQATAEDYVCIDYTGSYFAGTGAQEVTFGEACNFDIELQLGEVIRGLEDGIVGMKVGGQRRISIPARLAYGAKGCYPNIPPQMPLFIVVTLHKVYTRVLED